MSKKQKTIILTGGTKGIGESIARYFHNQGHKVLISARSDSGLAKTLGLGAKFVAADVRKLKDHRRLISKAIEWTGGVDVYINNAGFSAWRPIEDVDQAFWDEMIETNLAGTYWGCKAAAEVLKAGGAIINVASIAGKRGSANNSVYCASKFGVIGLTQALAKELGPKGIRVNAVCPVYVKSEGLMAALADKRSPTGGRDIGVYLDKFAEEAAALKRLPTGEEVAAMCYFLASEAASAVTGQSINVDCGVLPS